MKEVNIREEAENISNMKKWNILFAFFRYLLVATSPLVIFVSLNFTIVSVLLTSVILYYLHGVEERNKRTISAFNASFV